MPARGVLCVAAMAYLGVASVEATKTRWHVRTSARFASAPPGSSSPADGSHAPVTIAGRFALAVAQAFRTNSSSAPFVVGAGVAQDVASSSTWSSSVVRKCESCCHEQQDASHFFSKTLQPTRACK